MDTSFEQKVREKAYEIWVSAGMADGMAHEHWVSAEKAVANETGKPMKAAAKKPAAPKAKPAVKPAKAKVMAKTPAKATAKSSNAKH